MEKKIILSANTKEDFDKALKAIDELGIGVISTSYHEDVDQYDILMCVTLTEAYALLDLSKQIGGILWKGES